MSPGSFHTLNLKGTTLPNTHLFVTGTTEVDLSDSEGNFVLYPTILKSQQDIEILVVAPGRSLQITEINVSEIPRHQSAHVGTLELAGEASSLTEIKQIPVETAEAEVVVVETEAPFRIDTPVTPTVGWYDPLVLPLVLTLLVVLAIVGLRKYRVEVREKVFLLKVALGRFDKDLSKEFLKRRDVARKLRDLQENTAQRLDKVREALHDVGVLQGDKVEEHRLELQGELDGLEKVEGEIDEHLTTALAGQRALKLALEQGSEFGADALAELEHLQEQTQSASDSLQRSDDHLRSLHQAHRELAGLKR